MEFFLSTFINDEFKFIVAAVIKSKKSRMKKVTYILFVLCIFIAHKTIAYNPISEFEINKEELIDQLYIVYHGQKKQTILIDIYNTLNRKLDTLNSSILKEKKELDEESEGHDGGLFNPSYELLKSTSGYEKSQSLKKGKLIYDNPMSDKESLINWSMEGPGTTEFKDNWMHLYSPNEEGHHVLWCPDDIPGSFIAEWEVQNMETDAGLLILFFSAKGVKGEDIFDQSLKKRDGIFKGYTRSDINNYHISYYANGRDNPERVVAHLRKNTSFNLVQNGEYGIPANSEAIHKVVLSKNDNKIIMTINDREVINWTDDGKKYGLVLQDGKMGFRQMQWTHFRYRNFKVYALE